MSFSKIVLAACLVVGASSALSGGPFVPHRGPGGYSGRVGVYPLHPLEGYPVVSYTDRRSEPLTGSWERGGSLSIVGAQTPDENWTPMFSPARTPTKVQGVPVSSLRGSAQGSYIYVGPGRRGGKEFSSTIQGLPPEGTIEWSKK